MTSFREAALRAAVSDIGVTEHPPNSNWGPRVSQYLVAAGIHTPAPWCMAAVHFWFKEAGLDLKYPNEASVGFFQQWANQHGYVVHAPERGDVVCYQFDADNWPDHVGIVEKVDGGTIHTVEGNTAYGNDANGGQVMRRVRRISRCVFVRIPGDQPGPTPAQKQANQRRLATLRAWLLKRRDAGWSWKRLKSTANFREFKRRGGK